MRREHRYDEHAADIGRPVNFPQGGQEQAYKGKIRAGPSGRNAAGARSSEWDLAASSSSGAAAAETAQPPFSFALAAVE